MNVVMAHAHTPSSIILKNVHTHCLIPHFPPPTWCHLGKNPCSSSDTVWCSGMTSAQEESQLKGAISWAVGSITSCCYGRGGRGGVWRVRQLKGDGSPGQCRGEGGMGLASMQGREEHGYNERGGHYRSTHAPPHYYLQREGQFRHDALEQHRLPVRGREDTVPWPQQGQCTAVRGVPCLRAEEGEVEGCHA